MTAAMVLLGMPITFLVTMALLPLWSAVERRFGTESVGHSGPAAWCFWLVFLIYFAAAWALARPFRDRR